MEKKLSVVGIDIAKQVFHLVGMDEQGTILVRKRLYRAQVMAFIAQLPPTRIGMEACGGAHDWARRFREHGHEVQLMAPQFVKPYSNNSPPPLMVTMTPFGNMAPQSKGMWILQKYIEFLH